ncbi:retrotransposon protein, putative, ty1-copia subclass [Tanacetum coccineum]
MFSLSTRLFSFHFSSHDGLNAMLENGPWFIRSHPIILKKWDPNVNLLKEDVGNIPVWVKHHGVPVTAFSEDGLSVIATKLGTPIMLDSYTADMCLHSWECPKSPGLGAGAGETKNPKKTSQAPKGYLVGPKMAFKPNQEYRPVTKKQTANSSGNKKKVVVSTSKVSDSNPFEVLNSVDNDVEMGTNEGTSNLDKNGANSSEYSFWNVENSSTSTTLIMDKIDNEDEVASIDNDMARSLASKRTGFGTKILLEQWTYSYGNGDYDDDPYDDDMYEGQF